MRFQNTQMILLVELWLICSRMQLASVFTSRFFEEHLLDRLSVFRVSRSAF